MSPEGLQNMQ